MNVFTKTFIASAITSLTAASVNAAEPLTAYGMLNVTVQSNDVYNSLTNRRDSETRIQSNSSRIGVKGEFDLPYALQAFYTIEYGVYTDNADANNLRARNQFVGLKGSFGAVSLGRNDTALKRSQGKVDQFNYLSGDIKNLFAGENRMAQTASYMSPSFEHVSVGLTYVAEGDSGQIRTPVTTPIKTDGYSAAVMYGDAYLRKMPFYVAVAYDYEVKGYNVLRVTAQSKTGPVTVGAMYQQEEKSENGEYKRGYMVSTSYEMNMIALKAQYQDMEDKGNSWSVGADYQLGQPTKLFAFYTSRDYDSTPKDDEFFGVGISHNF